MDSFLGRRANMDSEMIQERPYIAAMNGDWENMVDYYKENLQYLFSPVTLSLDTGLHLAVHSNDEQPLKELLAIMEGREFFLTESLNKFGNTVLHEATIYGNSEAVRLLVDRYPYLISITNKYGETPLFTAAAFGEAEIVEFLIATKPEECVDCNGRILSIHRQRSKDGQSILHQRSKDGLSILGAAIIGQHFGDNYSSLYIILNFKKYTHIYKTFYNFSIPNFMNAETALLLLELDESLHGLEDKMGRTALQLLAEMPTGFESGYPMGIFERLIYSCMPTPTTLLELAILPTCIFLDRIPWTYTNTYTYN